MQRCEYTQLAEYVSSTAVKQTSMERSHSWALPSFLDLISAACAQTIANSDSQFSLSEDQGSSRAHPDSFALFLRREAFAAPSASRCALAALSLFVPLASGRHSRLFAFRPSHVHIRRYLHAHGPLSVLGLMPMRAVFPAEHRARQTGSTT
jgi:hypothetical protein